MGLERLQAVLARLYTDENFRERFFWEPEAVAIEVGLSSEEARRLKSVATGIEAFARSLLRKRLGEVRKLLPATSHALGENCEQWFYRHARSYVPSGVHRHHNDARAFARFLQAVRDEAALPDWLIEVARYEAMWLETVSPAFRFRLALFYGRVDLLVSSFQAGIPLREAWASTPTRQLYLGLWFRNRDGSVTHRML